MQLTTNPSTLNKSATNDRRRNLAAAPKDLVAARTTQAAILTAFAIAMGVGFYAWLGLTALALFVVGLPVSLWLLWQSTDVVRNDER